MTTDNRYDPSRLIKANTGTTLEAKSWLTEAPLRMLRNNLDPEVAEIPEKLVVYGGIGRAARDWDCYDTIERELSEIPRQWIQHCAKELWVHFVIYSFLF